MRENLSSEDKGSNQKIEDKIRETQQLAYSRQKTQYLETKK